MTFAQLAYQWVERGWVDFGRGKYRSSQQRHVCVEVVKLRFADSVIKPLIQLLRGVDGQQGSSPVATSPLDGCPQPPFRTRLDVKRSKPS